MTLIDLIPQTPFLIMYNYAGIFLIASGLYLASASRCLGVHKKGHMRVLANNLSAFGQVSLGVGLEFKLFGTPLGEWLIISGDFLIPIGSTLAIYLAVREVKKT